MSERATRSQRYATMALPAYRYRPGQGAHPTRDPLGHSYGRAEAVISIDSERWSTCEPYLHAIDLFNHGYFWEAHEAIEGLWRGAGRESTPGVFLHGLIQLSAALLKHSLGELAGARRLASRGCTKLRAASCMQLGIDGAELAEQAEAYLDGRSTRAPAIVLAGLAHRSD